MIEVFILKIENPDCFWVRIKGSEMFVDKEVEYKKLEAEMNLFYNKFSNNTDSIRPPTLKEGQVCVVYCQETKSWCRAVVQAIISSTDDYLVECFLVDYARKVTVKTNRICIPLEEFMQLPYRAKKCRLYCTKPVTLQLDFCNDIAKIVPTDRWDFAAIQYFRNLLNVTGQAEATLCAAEGDCLDVYLYVTIQDTKLCVNDDLVAKNFACYETKKDKTQSIAKDQKKQPPFRLKSCSKEMNSAAVLWPMLLNAKESILSVPASDKKTCKNLQGTESCNGITESNVVMALPSLEKGITVSVQSDVQAESTLCEKAAKLQKEKALDEKNISLKLLQFLKPDSLKVDDRLNEKEGFQLNTCLPVVLSNKIEPCLTVETAPLIPDLKKAILQNQLLHPTHTQSYSWPPIARGCDTVIICPENDPLLYLLPLITFLQSRSCYVLLPAKTGPVATILCPGQKKAEQVFKLLEIYTRYSRPLYPVLLFLGTKKEEIKGVKLPSGCEVIVTTPHSLLRLLEYHSLLFLRLCHLVLDEAEILFSEASEQVFNILDYYKKNFCCEERECAPQQIVAVGRRWTQNIEDLAQKLMNEPYIVITAMEEAAVYGNVQQVVQFCLDCDKISTLLHMLDFITTHTQKTMIFTSSAEETDKVCKAVESASVFCLKFHPGVRFNLDNVVKSWTKKLSSGAYVLLVLTDDCSSDLGITDATCVIHFSFPPSPRIFGERLYSMSANFQNSIEKSSCLEQGQSKAKSVLLLTEKNACLASGALLYLERTKAKIPPELCSCIAKMLEAKEDNKSERPLCHKFKMYGICRDQKRCSDRHHVNLQTDLPRKITDETLPTAGNVTILPLFIVDATNYFGHIVNKQKDLYLALAEEMNEYYEQTSNHISVDKVEKLALYGLQEENSFHRVQALEVTAKGSTFYSVPIKYIDEGRHGQVQNCRLLYLPEKFKDLPPQAVEFVVCRIKPIDNEIEWNSKVTRYISYKIRGKMHEAKIVLTLGNTIWVDSVIRVTRLPELKTVISEYNIRSVILSTGMGVDNPNHVPQLQKLFRDATIRDPEKRDFPALTPTLKCVVSELAHPSILDKTSPKSQNIQEQVLGSVQSAEERDDITSVESSQSVLQNHCGEMAQRKKAENSLQTTCKCPTTEISQSPLKSSQASHSGEIGDHSVPPQSACAGGKRFAADLELQRNILKEKSTCVLKSDEVTISLAKEKEEPWHTLLKHKNPNVSFDFDHLEDSEEKSIFAAVTGPRILHPIARVLSEEDAKSSSEDSDTESGDSSSY